MSTYRGWSQEEVMGAGRAFEDGQRPSLMGNSTNIPNSTFTPINSRNPPDPFISPVRTLRHQGIIFDDVYNLPDDDDPDYRVSVITGEQSISDSTRTGDLESGDATGSILLGLTGGPSKKRKATPAKRAKFNSAISITQNEPNTLNMEEQLEPEFPVATPPKSGRPVKGRSKPSGQNAKPKKLAPFKAPKITKPSIIREKEATQITSQSQVVASRNYKGWTTTEDAVRLTPNAVTIAKTTLDKLASFRYRPVHEGHSSDDTAIGQTKGKGIGCGVESIPNKAPDIGAPISSLCSTLPCRPPSFVPSYSYSNNNAALNDDLIFLPGLQQGSGRLDHNENGFPSYTAPDAYEDVEHLPPKGLTLWYSDMMMLNHHHDPPSDEPDLLGDFSPTKDFDIHENHNEYHGVELPTQEAHEPKAINLLVSAAENADAGPSDSLTSGLGVHQNVNASVGDHSGYTPVELQPLPVTELVVYEGDVRMPQMECGMPEETQHKIVDQTITHRFTPSPPALPRKPDDDEDFDEGLDDADLLSIMPGALTLASQLATQDVTTIRPIHAFAALPEYTNRLCHTSDNSDHEITMVPPIISAVPLALAVKPPSEAEYDMDEAEEVELLRLSEMTPIPVIHRPQVISLDSEDEYDMDGVEEDELLRISAMMSTEMEKFSVSPSFQYPFADQESEVFDATLQFSPPKSTSSRVSLTHEALVGNSLNTDNSSSHSSPDGRHKPTSDVQLVGMEDEWAFLHPQVLTDAPKGPCASSKPAPNTSVLPSSPAVATLNPHSPSIVDVIPNSSSTAPVLDDSDQYQPLGRFTRQDFPSLICDRSPVNGLSAQTFLRTCFRIAEMYKEGKRCNSFGQDAIIELFAKIKYSSRESGTVKQHFQFADLFDDHHPPFPYGTLMNCKITSLADTESKALISGEGKLVRCFGRLKRDAKNTTGWLLHVSSIRETDWEEIRYTKRVVCANEVK